MKDILKVVNFSLSYFQEDAEYKVMNEVSLNVAEGEFTSIIGPSGCGKSSLIRCMIGLQKPTSGKIFFNGRQVVRPPIGMSLIFQNIALIPWQTALENVEFALENSGLDEKEKREKSLKALEEVKLTGFENAYPSELSGGMKQRVGIARGIVSAPDVLLMDEPFSSLDELTAEQLRGEVHEILESPKFPVKAVVMVSHNVEEVVELSDRIIVLSKSPARIIDEIKVKTRYPRDRQSKEFVEMTDRLLNDLLVGEE